MQERIRVLVVDDHTVFAEGLRLLLERDERMRVVGVASSVAEATALARELRPDVILMDQCLGDERGVSAIGRIRELVPGTSVIVLTGGAVSDTVAGAVEAGASGVIDKVVHPDELVRSIERARNGENLFSPAIVSEVMRARRRQVTKRERMVGSLTPRESEVLRLLAEGCDSKGIATRLGLSVHTARDHVQSVLEKLDAHSRIEAVLRAGELGLVRI
ncbi:MAG: response regulator transcription factor [Chloroflexi bacterium]|nr:response regulator transcription factor [Chloroflexota bacterium]